MDFAATYTEEQEEFRKEVRAFVEENVPQRVKDAHANDELALLDRERWLIHRDLGRKLGEKGWLYPTLPSEYGGGGLTGDHATVIIEELDRYGLSNPPYYNSGGNLGGPSILVWGTDEQKSEFLPPIFRGEVVTWQLLTEPEAGTDLAGARLEATRDGDDYVLNGQKHFVGAEHDVDFVWTLARTDPDAPRHSNLSWFMIPTNLPGITINRMELLGSGGEGGAGSGTKCAVFFDDARVSGFNLVGGENNGWRVATTHLELEHGGGGSINRNPLMDRFIEACKTTQRNGQPLSKDPDVRRLIVENFIDSEIGRLFGMRNFWLAHSGRPRSYEGSQSSMWRKTRGVTIATKILQALGPHALSRGPQAPVQGHLETNQRGSIVAVHPAGTVEAQKIIISRRLGIGRATREEAGRIS